MKRTMFITISSILLLFLSACGQDGATKNEKDSKDKLKIYTTIYPFQYFTERIGGEQYLNRKHCSPWLGCTFN